MANVDNPYGLRPVGHISGASWNGATRRCWVDSTATALGIGDAVIWNGSGSGAYPEVQQTAGPGDGNPIFGVITDIEPRPSEGLDSMYITSAGEGWVNVCCDPSVVFEMQGNGVIGPDDYGANSNLVFDHTVNTTTGISGTELDSTTGTNGSYQLLILGGVDRADNDLTLTHADYLVMICHHSLSTANGEGPLGV